MLYAHRWFAVFRSRASHAALALIAAACNPRVDPTTDGSVRPGPGAGGGGAPRLDAAVDAPPAFGSAIPGLRSIAVTPADQTLTIDGNTAAISTYRAVGTFDDGRSEDVTTRVVFRLADPTLGTFTGPRFTSGLDRGGRAEIVAAAGSVEGRALLTLLLRKRVADPTSPGLPPDPGGRFGGAAAAARAPDVVYPADGVVLPPNLGRLEVHFLSGAGNTLFEVAFVSPTVDVRVHMRCTNPMKGGCIHGLDPQVWRWVAGSNRGGAVELTVKGTDDAGAEVGTSAPLTVSFAPQDIQGGIYYWTTSGGTGIMRYDFASSQVMAEKWLGTELSSGTCIGCHALSRDGTKMVAAAGTPRRGQLLLLQVAGKRPILQIPASPRSVFESWKPDDTQYVGVWGELTATDFNLLLFNGNTGQLEGTIDVGGTRERPTTHPDWSFDGRRIVFTRVGQSVIRQGGPRLQEIIEGSIHMVTAQGAGWSAAEEVVPQAAGRNRYYPAFAPDNKVIVYDESVCPGGLNTSLDCDADSDPSARLWAVLPRAGATPVELGRANAGGKMDMGAQDLTTSFPKWCPFEFARGNETRLHWLTFSSSRKYGLRDPPPSTDLPAGLLIWMTAINPDEVVSGRDPSAPAFVLPFQDITTSNHIAQWTKKVIE
jgi:hypothetical protein